MTIKTFFEEHPYINPTILARNIGISEESMRGYARGTSNPSPERMRRIEESIRHIARDMRQIRLRPPHKEKDYQGKVALPKKG